MRLLHRNNRGEKYSLTRYSSKFNIKRHMVLGSNTSFSILILTYELIDGTCFTYIEFIVLHSNFLHIRSRAAYLDGQIPSRDPID